MIEIKDVQKIYNKGELDETQALKGVSFKINDGEFVAIMGPSGSGKSTLMHILGALDTPTSGKFFLDGRDVSKLSEHELADLRKKIGFVFQSFNLLPRTTVLKNVTLPLIYARISKVERIKKAKEALLSTGLDEAHFNHFSNQLSGGQMQRVAIARALVNNPSLILADEPTGNLDSRTSLEIIDIFQKLNRQSQITIILVTHEPDIARYAGRQVVFRDGKIIQDHPLQPRQAAEDLGQTPAAGEDAS